MHHSFSFWTRFPDVLLGFVFFCFFLLPRLNIVIITSYYNPMCCGMCLLNVTSLAGITRCFIGWHLAQVGNAELDTGTLRLRWEDTGLLAQALQGACCSHATQYSGICLMLKKNQCSSCTISEILSIRIKTFTIMCIMSYNVFFNELFCLLPVTLVIIELPL